MNTEEQVEKLEEEVRKLKEVIKEMLKQLNRKANIRIYLDEDLLM